MVFEESLEKTQPPTPLVLSELVRGEDDPELGVIPAEIDCFGLTNHCKTLANRGRDNIRENGLVLDHEYNVLADLVASTNRATQLDFTQVLERLGKKNEIILHNHIPVDGSFSAMKNRNAITQIEPQDNLSPADLLGLLTTHHYKTPRVFGVVNGGSLLFGIRTKQTPLIRKPTLVQKLNLFKDVTFFIAGTNLTYLLDTAKFSCTGNFANLQGEFCRKFNIDFAKKHHVALFQVGNFTKNDIAKRIA
jgi:hypothetical protein